MKTKGVGDVIKKAAKLLLVAALLLPATGCWSRRELNDLAIAAAIGIDKRNGEFEVSAQVTVPGEVASKKTGGDSSMPVVTFYAKGKTVFEAVRKLTTITPRKIYFSHIRMLVFGEDLAREGIAETLDVLSRDHELRTDFYIAVVKGASAKELLAIFTPMEKIPANRLFSSLEISDKTWGQTAAVHLDEFIDTLVSKGKSPALTGIRIIGDPVLGSSKENIERIDVPVSLKYVGIGVFNKDKLVGWLNVDESRGYNYITDEIQNTTEVVPCPQGGRISTEVIRSKTELKGKVVNGSPQAYVHVRVEQNVADVGCNLDLTKPKTIVQLEAMTRGVIEDKINKVVHAAQRDYKVDIFGFGEAIRRDNPRMWKKWEKDWNRHFEDMTVNVKVEVKIRGIGTVSNSILKEMEER